MRHILLKNLIIIQFIFWLLVSFVTNGQNTPVAQNGQLKVCGTYLCNQYDKPIQLRGMSTHGIQWYGWGNCITEASLNTLAYDWEADILRISLYVQEGGYETDPEGFTNQVSQLIDEATKRGMYALVDWHQLNPGDPNYNLENAKRFFTAIATRHKNNDNIIYDVCNEPNGSGVTWNRIKTYADQIIPVIQSIDNDAVVLVGTQGWSTFGVSGQGNLQDVLNNPLQYENVMYTFHFYAKSHGELYVKRLEEASRQLPVFVTEFGSQEASGDGPNDFGMTQQFIDLMQQKKISWTSWNFSDDFRTGAVWETGTCSGGLWTTDKLKPAGAWIRDKIKYPVDDFPGAGGNTDQSSYGGTPILVPGKIEAENYDLGGSDIAFNDVSVNNEGNAYRNEPVDIEICSEGGYNIGWVKAGEWLEYTVDVSTSKKYVLESRVAAISSGRKFHIEIDGKNISGQINIPNTGGWQNWETVTTDISLDKGMQIMRIVMDSDDFNLNHMIFRDIINPPNQPPTVVLTSPKQDSVYKEGQTLNMTANANDIDGAIIKVDFFIDGIKISEDRVAPYTANWTPIKGNHTIKAVATDTNNSTMFSEVTVTIEAATEEENCDAPLYSQNESYMGGNRVQNDGSIYSCKPWPYSGWCNGNPNAYAPGTGSHWKDAWIKVGDCTTRIEPQESSFIVIKNYPNPFDKITNFQLKLKQLGSVAFVIYNTKGTVVAIQPEIKINPGVHTIPMDLSSLNAGIYFCKISIDGKDRIIKIIKE